jgi:hypothetical protein
MLKDNFPFLIGIEPSNGLDGCIELDFIEDFVLGTNIVEVADDFFSGRKDAGPAWVLSERVGVKDGRSIFTRNC